MLLKVTFGGKEKVFKGRYWTNSIPNHFSSSTLSGSLLLLRKHNHRAHMLGSQCPLPLLPSVCLWSCLAWIHFPISVCTSPWEALNSIVPISIALVLTQDSILSLPGSQHNCSQTTNNGRYWMLYLPKCFHWDFTAFRVRSTFFGG